MAAGAQRWQHPSLPGLQSSHPLAEGSWQEVQAFELSFPLGWGSKREEQVGRVGATEATTAHLRRMLPWVRASPADPDVWIFKEKLEFRICASIVLIFSVGMELNFKTLLC